MGSKFCKCPANVWFFSFEHVCLDPCITNIIPDSLYSTLKAESRYLYTAIDSLYHGTITILPMKFFSDILSYMSL